MISPLAQKRRQKILLIVLGLVILAIVIVLVWGYEGVTILPEEFIPPEMPEKIEEVELDFTILTEPPFADFKSYGDLPVEKGITGRTNPFLPYQ